MVLRLSYMVRYSPLRLVLNTMSKPLPLGRYKVVESKAAEFYGLDKTPIEVEIEHAGQIVKTAMTNKALYTNVSIKKTGYTEVMPPGMGVPAGQPFMEL